MYSYKELQSMLDYELRQSTGDQITAVPNSYRKEKSTQLIYWTNQSLATWAGRNPDFWRTVRKITPAEESDILVPDFYMLRIYGIKEGTWATDWDVVYSAEAEYNDRVRYVSFGKNQIHKTCGNFSPENNVFLSGAVMPEKVIDEASIIDFPDEHIRFLLLSIVMKYTGKNNLPNGLLFDEYKDLRKNFISAKNNVYEYGDPDPSFGIDNEYGIT